LIVCESCGEWVKVRVDRDVGSVDCEECGASQAIRLMPLFVVTGPSGAGKTAVIPHLRERLPEVDVFETDQIWDSGGDWQMVKCNWVRVALAVAQSGRASVLCGTILPKDLASCDHAALFRCIHYLALTCSDDARERRLRNRKGVLASTDAFIQEHHRFARWLAENADTAFDPVLRIVDTTIASPDETATFIEEWVREILPHSASDQTRVQSQHG
jgi:hypothetical protein